MIDESPASVPPASLPPDAAAGPVPPRAPLARDVPCVACGYNLRGLRPQGRCPECGRAIDESLRSELLSFASPRHLRRLRAGLMILVCAQLANALTGVAHLVPFAAWLRHLLIGRTLAGRHWLWFTSEWAEWWSVFKQMVDAWPMTIPLAFVELLAALLLTGDDPGHPGPDARLRKLARWMLGLAFLADAASHVIDDACARLGVGTMESHWAWLVLATVSLLSFTSGWFALLVWLERLARRTPRPRVARWLRLYRWAFVGCASLLFSVLMLTGVAMVLHYFDSAPGLPEWFLGVHTSLEGLAYLVLLPATILFIHLLLTLRRAMGRLLPDHTGQSPLNRGVVEEQDRRRGRLKP